MTEKWTGWHTVGLVVIPVAIVLFGIVIPKERPLLLWLLNLGALILILLVAGHGKTGRFWFGWLTNKQNRMSLSRLQMFLWTFIVLSAFLTVIMINFKAKEDNPDLNPVAITLPQELLVAMGISTTSLVGSPLILKEKEQRALNRKFEVTRRETELSELKNKWIKLSEERSTMLTKPKSTESTESRNKLGKDESNEGSALGLFSELEKSLSSELKRSTPDLSRHLEIEKSRFYDLISGENENDENMLDLSRLQNLFFTLILIGGYAVALGSMLINTSFVTAFPEISASSIALLGISHAGYLGGKTR
ncbi:MAG: hypothetical protein AYK19_18375 [Theionarchaea archaeon DG-70-1]|nr:MAG: hypothetical protein AYK19_18375 [Theionarchaea archaeon DG-70-1]